MGNWVGYGGVNSLLPPMARLLRWVKFHASPGMLKNQHSAEISAGTIVGVAATSHKSILSNGQYRNDFLILA